MDEVRATLKLRLLKNLPLSRLIEAVEGEESARTYAQLQGEVGELGIEDIIGIVEF